MRPRQLVRYQCWPLVAVIFSNLAVQGLCEAEPGSPYYKSNDRERSYEGYDTPGPHYEHKDHDSYYRDYSRDGEEAYRHHDSPYDYDKAHDYEGRYKNAEYRGKKMLCPPGPVGPPGPPGPPAPPPPCGAWPESTTAVLGDNIYNTADTQANDFESMTCDTRDFTSYNTFFFNWTAPEDGEFNINTCKTPRGFLEDTVINVYTEASCFLPVAPLAGERNMRKQPAACPPIVARNDDKFQQCPGFQSAVTIQATADTTYIIAVGQVFDQAFGPGVLEIKPPPVRDEFSGPAEVVTINRRQARKDPNGRTTAPTHPYRHVMPRLNQTKPGSKAVCDAHVAYDDVGPSDTTCKFFMNIFDDLTGQTFASSCTAWFIEEDLVVTAGHCVHSGDGGNYFLDQNDPGYICCNPDRNNSCPNDSLFNVVAWVTTKGFAALPFPEQFRNDGAVLRVQPSTAERTFAPETLPLATFNGAELPPLNITTSGFPCSDSRSQGCDATNGLDSVCATRRGYTLPNALPILDTNNANGNVLRYTASGCGGHSGGPVSTPIEGTESGFAILVGGMLFCALDGDTAAIVYSQVVDQVQEFGVYVAALADAVTRVQTRRAVPKQTRPPRRAKGPTAHPRKQAKAPKEKAQPRKQG